MLPFPLRFASEDLLLPVQALSVKAFLLPLTHTRRPDPILRQVFHSSKPSNNKMIASNFIHPFILFFSPFFLN